MAPPYLPVYNPTDRPVTVDREGRNLGGGEWGPAEAGDDAVKAALADGRLVAPDLPDGANLNDGAKTAKAAAAELNERHAAFARLDAAQVEALAIEHDIPPAVGRPTSKADLVAALTARTAIPVPAVGKPAGRPTATEE